jgi:hypothetical protein
MVQTAPTYRMHATTGLHLTRLVRLAIVAFALCAVVPAIAAIEAWEIDLARGCPVDADPPLHCSLTNVHL